MFATLAPPRKRSKPRRRHTASQSPSQAGHAVPTVGTSWALAHSAKHSTCTRDLAPATWFGGGMVEESIFLQLRELQANWKST